MADDQDQAWRAISEDIVTGVWEWRLQHPTATLAEIAAAVDTRRAPARHPAASGRPRCRRRCLGHRPHGRTSHLPLCQTPLGARGKQPRRLQAAGGRDLVRDRTSGVSPTGGGGRFPRDDERARRPSRSPPHVHAAVGRLGAWMPFAEAAAILDHLRGVQVTPDTVRRQTEAAGDAYRTHQPAEVDALLPGAGAVPTPSDRLVVSADGALVPLLHGAWAAATTLAVGVVDPPGTTTSLAYCARRCDAATFTELATVATCRRGVAQVPQVAAVVDGAAWRHGLLDVQGPQAVRILAVPHAPQRLSPIGQAVFGDGSTPGSRGWRPNAPRSHTRGRNPSARRSARWSRPTPCRGRASPRMARPWKNGWGRCTIRPTRRPAGRWAAGSWKARTRWGWKRG